MLITRPARYKNWLRAVAAVSSSNVWAVGQQAPQGEGPQLTLIEHWNGKAVTQEELQDKNQAKVDHSKRSYEHLPEDASRWYTRTR